MKKLQIVSHLLMNREISIKRIANFAKNWFSYAFKSSYAAGYPSVLMVEPTNYCNLKCPLCPIGEGTFNVPRGSMSLKNYKKIIDELGDYLLNLTLWNYGEPFMNKNIYDMIEYAKKKNIFVRISSNGHFFNNKKGIETMIKSGMDNLIIALDGASQKTFSKYRKQGNFNRVIKSIKAIAEEKKRLKSKNPFIEIQFVVMKHNEHEINKIRKIAREIGVDKVTLKTVSLDVFQSGDKEKMSKFLPSDENLSRYTKKGNEIERKIKNNKCKRLYFSSVINWDGSVSPCCYDPNRKYEIGNMFKAGSFKKVWNNEKYRKFRESVLKNKQNMNMCKNCSGNLMGLNVE